MFLTKLCNIFTTYTACMFRGFGNNSEQKINGSCGEYGLISVFMLKVIYSRLSLSRLRLSRITAYLEEKI